MTGSRRSFKAVATYYDRLGVKPTATPQQIRRAYRDLSKLYHPDTTQLPPAEATEKFQQLNEAYAALSNPERRLAYDQQVGYSRIAVIQAPADLNRSVRERRPYGSNAYLDPNDRPLSAGEIFALFILGLTFMACLALVVTIGLTQTEGTTLAWPPSREAEAAPQAALEAAPATPALPPKELELSLPETPTPSVPSPKPIDRDASLRWL